MSAFDSEPGTPFAVCIDCGVEFVDRPAMSAHLNDTFTAGESHKAQIKNLTRPERIQRKIRSIADDALFELVDELLDLSDGNDVTEDEISEAIRFIDLDLASAWAERDS